MKSKFLMLLLWQGTDQSFSTSNKSLSKSAVTKIYFKKCFKEESNYLHFGYKEEEHLSCLVLVFIFFRLPIHGISFLNVDFFFFSFPFFLAELGLHLQHVNISSCSLQAPWLLHTGFVALWHVGSQFPDQGSNPCPLHWKADS